MRKHIFLFYIFVILILLVGCSDNNKKVLMMPREGSENLAIALGKESGVMLELLKNAGFEVIIATDSGKELKTGNLQLLPDLKYSEVEVEDYIGIIMPCMNAGTDLKKIPDEAIRIVQEADKSDLPIAAQLGSVLILEVAGVWSPDLANIPADEQYRDWGGDGVYTYNNIITSGTCPFLAKTDKATDRTEELTNKFIEILN